MEEYYSSRTQYTAGTPRKDRPLFQSYSRRTRNSAQLTCSKLSRQSKAILIRTISERVLRGALYRVLSARILRTPYSTHGWIDQVTKLDLKILSVVGQQQISPVCGVHVQTTEYIQYDRSPAPRTQPFGSQQRGQNVSASLSTLVASIS